MIAKKIINVKTLIFIFMFSIFIFPNTSPGNSPEVIHNGKLIYLANTVVIKYKNGFTLNKTSPVNYTAQLNNSLKQFEFQSVQSMFGGQNDITSVGLNRIMLVRYKANTDPLIVAAKMSKLPNVEWAEPKFLRRVTVVPDDPNFNSVKQWNLFKISAEKAWNIMEGDTTVIIGIVDTGVDWTHPDLRANMWYKIGYDLGGTNGTPDNNPMEDNPYHGTFVAGVASAVTDNNIGIASIGFKSKLMAVKAAREDVKDPSSGVPYIYYGFEGIKYAVDNGAKVINCSWGGSGYSNMEQEVVDYAVSNGALVVAAAGNDSSSSAFYPASYKGVLSVAATDQNDLKAWFSNYGTGVDVCAPGVGIYSTWQPNTYLANGLGTSFSAPLASGLAALVFARYPKYTPLQVAEQIRVNCDSIYQINPQYKYLLGGGRINAYKALADSNSISVRAFNVQFSDPAPGGNADGVFQPGETITVKVKFRNYLSTVNDLNVSLQSLNNYSTVDNGTYRVSSMKTLDSTNNNSDVFTITLADSMPANIPLAYKLEYSGNSYMDFQLIQTVGNVSFSTQSGNNVALTITSNGNLGYNDYPTNLQGEGFKYNNGPDLLFEGSLMLGTSANNLSDEARGANQNFKDSSFITTRPFKLKIPGTESAEEGTTIFNDNGSGNNNKLGVSIRLNSYTYNDASLDNLIVLNYIITNNSGANISNLYTGLFFDWDLAGGDGDITSYDSTGHFGYVYHQGGNPDTWVGTALISDNNYGFWGILNDGSDNGFGIYDGFTKSEKWQSLSSGIGKPKGGPGDISEVTSGGPYSIDAGKSIQVGFAVAAGSSLNDLTSYINAARDKYKSISTDTGGKGTEIPNKFVLEQNYPNPFNPNTIISFIVPHSSHVTIKIYNMLGMEVKTLVDENMQARSQAYTVTFNAAGYSSGIYFYKMTAGSFSETRKMVLLK